jgi:putative membrane protein
MTKKMKKLSLFLCLILGAWSFQSCSNRSDKDSVEQAKDINDDKADSTVSVMAVSEKDSKFMVDAANAGMTEVEMGNMAQQKGMDSHVKSYAAMMVADHSKANDELRALASSKNVTLPSSVGDDMQKHMNDMREKSGRDFDKDYIDMMVSDHKKVVDDFESCANNCDDADVRGWASRTLATLRAHRDSAQSIQDMMKDRK